MNDYFIRLNVGGWLHLSSRIRQGYRTTRRFESASRFQSEALAREAIAELKLSGKGQLITMTAVDV